MYTLKLLTHFPIEVEEVCNQFKEKNKNKSSITRDLKWLNFKWGDDLKIGCFDTFNNLKGYAVIKEDSGFILDFVLLDTNDTQIVMNALKQEYDKYVIRKGVSNPGLKLMWTDFFKDNLKEIELKPIDYKFVFGLCNLRNSNLLNEIDLNSWYVFPKD
jgi:hypothetical protein